MGMDIYGIKPFKLIADVEQPKQPLNEASDKEWSVFIKARDYYDTNVSPGRYFRANLWSWRPIEMLCYILNDNFKLKLNMKGWGENSGKGLKSQKKCDLLASQIEKRAKEFEEEGISKVYLDVSGIEGTKGMYVKHKGVDGTPLALGSTSFVTDEEMEGKYKDGIKFIQDQGLYVRHPYIIEDLKDEYVLIEPAHSIYMPHIREFVRFLRNCGGFEIW